MDRAGSRGNRILAWLAAMVLLAAAGACLDPIPPETLTEPGNGAVKGTVKDLCKGAPISGVTVAARQVLGDGTFGEQRSTTTDAAGAFAHRNLRPGSWELSVSREAYQTQQKSVQVIADREWTEDLTLSPALTGTLSTTKLDLLFVVDNSASMEQEQLALANAFPGFINTLLGYKVLLDLRVGVISTDMGAGALYQDSACKEGGDQGKLLLKGASSSCSLPTAPYLAVSHASGGGLVTNVPGDLLVDAFSCMVKLGTGGCGFEQPLGALALAIDGKTNAGFPRGDAALAVVVLTDEDDCSAVDSSLFDPGQQGLNDPLGPLTSFRCFEFGVTCQCAGGTACTRTTTGPRASCVPTSGKYMLDVGTLAAKLQALRPPGKRYFSVIGGPADRVEVGMQGSYPVLTPSCQTTTGHAVPAVRLRYLADKLSPYSSFDSICLTDLKPPLETLARRIAETVLLSPCK